jgi:flagellar biogenesis protein FliO
LFFIACPLAAAQEKTTAGKAPATAQAGQPPAHGAQDLPSLKEPAHGGDGKEGDGRPSSLQSLITVGGSLAAVIGVFLLLAWMMRKASPHGGATLPLEAFEVLGRASLFQRQQVQLLRLGSKLLLVSATASGVETLAEISDPAEVERLLDLCRPNRSQGALATFRRVLEQTSSQRGSKTQSASSAAPPRPQDKEQGHV